MARADTNVVVLVGRLTADPELRQTAGGTSVLSGRLAFTRVEKRNEEWSEFPNYIDVTLAWDKRADALADWLKKGSQVAVSGSLRFREWENKDGSKRSTIEVDAREVQMIDTRDGEKNTPERQRPRNDISDAPASSRPSDDVPF